MEIRGAFSFLVPQKHRQCGNDRISHSISQEIQVLDVPEFHRTKNRFGIHTDSLSQRNFVGSEFSQFRGSCEIGGQSDGRATQKLMSSVSM